MSPCGDHPLPLPLLPAHFTVVATLEPLVLRLGGQRDWLFENCISVTLMPNVAPWMTGCVGFPWVLAVLLARACTTVALPGL